MFCLAIIGLIANVAVTAATSYVYLGPTCFYYIATTDDHAISIYPPLCPQNHAWSSCSAGNFLVWISSDTHDESDLQNHEEYLLKSLLQVEVQIRVMLPNLTSRYLERFAICAKLNYLSH